MTVHVPEMTPQNPADTAFSSPPSKLSKRSPTPYGEYIQYIPHTYIHKLFYHLAEGTVCVLFVLHDRMWRNQCIASSLLHCSQYPSYLFLLFLLPIHLKCVCAIQRKIILMARDQPSPLLEMTRPSLEDIEKLFFLVRNLRLCCVIPCKYCCWTCSFIASWRRT